jgi:hypothetical protein
MIASGRICSFRDGEDIDDRFPPLEGRRYDARIGAGMPQPQENLSQVPPALS